MVVKGEVNEAIPIYGYRAELSANRFRKTMQIVVYSFGWNKHLAKLSELMSSGLLINYYVVFEVKNLVFPNWKKERGYFIAKILGGELERYQDFAEFTFDIELADREGWDELIKLLFFKSHGEGFWKIRKWKIELWDFNGVLLPINEDSEENIKNLGVGYLILRE